MIKFTQLLFYDMKNSYCKSLNDQMLFKICKYAEKSEIPFNFNNLLFQGTVVQLKTFNAKCFCLMVGFHYDKLLSYMYIWEHGNCVYVWKTEKCRAEKIRGGVFNIRRTSNINQQLTIFQQC